MDDELRTLTERLGQLWGLPQLASAVAVSYNPRLQRSLGRCKPSIGRVTLNPALRQATLERRAEVLCHELAHVAVFQLYGPAAKSHGREWRELVARAGYVPHVRSADVSGARTSPTSPSSVLPYEHRCPVCQSARYARRPVSRWRCAECLDAGLSGELLISRRPDSTSTS